jgi:hypothetical protein
MRPSSSSHAGTGAACRILSAREVPQAAQYLLRLAHLGARRRRQLQLLKSGKRQPVPVSSRCYSLKRQQFTFWHVQPEEIESFVARKIFWTGGVERQPVLIADPVDALYLDASDDHMTEKLLAAAKHLAGEGLAEMSGNQARATDALIARAAEFHAAKEKALDELHAKHAFERA